MAGFAWLDAELRVRATCLRPCPLR